MKLMEILVVLFIIGIFIYAVVPARNMYSTMRRDALRIASSLRACALYSIGNSFCSFDVSGREFRLGCSGGYSKTGHLYNRVSGKRHYNCSEGVIENPFPLNIGHFVVHVERRGIYVEVTR